MRRLVDPVTGELIGRLKPGYRALERAGQLIIERTDTGQGPAADWDDVPDEVLEMLDEFEADVAAGRLTEADVEELNRILDQAQPE